MNGRGPYRNFSIQNWGQRDGKPCIAFCLRLSRKPFLQQTLPEPVFIHWDLRNYPVTVFAYMVVGSDTKTDVVNCDTLVECHHPSIWRHAFVRKLQEGGPPHYGTVCTESTRFRLEQLLSRDKVFDPAEFLVEKLRSAARVLRYGLRRRGMGISQHNQFAKVPEPEFQAVVRGYGEARRFQTHGFPVNGAKSGGRFSPHTDILCDRQHWDQIQILMDQAQAQHLHTAYP